MNFLKRHWINIAGLIGFASIGTIQLTTHISSSPTLIGLLYFCLFAITVVLILSDISLDQNKELIATYEELVDRQEELIDQKQKLIDRFIYLEEGDTDEMQ